MSASKMLDRPVPRAGRHPDEGAVPRRLCRRWVPLAAAVLTAAVGVLDVGSALTPEVHSRVVALRGVVPGTVSNAASAGTAMAGLMLLLLARALRRRKHRAWQTAVVLLAVSVGLHLVKGLDVEEAIVAAVLLAALVAVRAEFYAVGDPRTRWRAAGMFVVLTLTSVGIGLLLLSLRDDELVGPHSLARQLRYVVYGLVGVTGPLRFHDPRVADLVSDILLGLGLLIALSCAYLALRPAEPPGALTQRDEEGLRALLAGHGTRDSLGYFALRRDKSVVFSPSGKAAVTYRVVSGVMLASGDPIGDPEAWPGALARFLEIADEHAWVPAVMGCSEGGGQAWRRAGLAVLELGDEAVVYTEDFTVAGRAMRGVRQAIGRVERAGYSSTVRRLRDIPAAERVELATQAAAWRGAQTERGFSMALGRFGDPADGDCTVVTAVQDGALRGFLHFVPWGPDGLSLDLMRRDRAADNGVNEFLIAAALSAAAEIGVRRLSLNFAMFRDALERGGRLGAGPVLRAWRGVLLFASRWFQIDSLYRFNAKFKPVWEPRFVCYPTTADLPRIALAALEAEAFIVWPRPSLHRLRRWAHRPADTSA